MHEPCEISARARPYLGYMPPHKEPREKGLQIEQRSVSPDYMRALGVKLVAGRWLEDHDRTVMTMQQLVSGVSGQPRFYAVLISIFGLIATSIAGIGIYGVLAYAVAQRTREIGIRVALGAERIQVLGLVLKQGAILAGVGLTIGLACSVVLTRYLSGMLFGLTPMDPFTYLAVGMGLTAIAMLASYIPARQAANVDPLISLRMEHSRWH